MGVGNDVVDLRDPRNQPSAIHPRFDIRVFGEDERALLDTVADRLARHRLRWTLWAAKEAAFKALARRMPGLRFHPRRFAVTAPAPRGGRETATVRHVAGVLDVRFHRTAARVHAVASDPGAPESVAGAAPIAARTAGTPHGASAEVRRLAARQIGALLDVPADRVEITRGGAPLAMFDGAPLPVLPSLSHDGRWVAWALSGAAGPVQSSNSFARSSTTSTCFSASERRAAARRSAASSSSRSAWK